MRHGSSISGHSEANSACDMNRGQKVYVITDWANNVMCSKHGACFYPLQFDTWDEAEEALSLKLGDSYDDERQEYEIKEKAIFNKTQLWEI